MAPTSTKPISVMVMRHAGAHLILPMVKSMTGKAIYRTKGPESLICEPSGKVIIFMRNPRNRLISFFRWKRGQLPTDAELAEFMTKPKRDGEYSPLEFATAWAKRWRHRKGALHVRFEDLADAVNGPTEIARMAGFLGVDADPNAVFASFVGKGTFTGRHSDWRTCFGPKSDRAYRRHGGAELDRLMGYDNG